MTILVLPPAAIEVLRQQAVLCGYQDPDPDHDYVGLCITAGRSTTARSRPSTGRRGMPPGRPQLSRVSAPVACKRRGIRVP